MLERRRSISRNAALRRASAFMIIRSMGSSFSLFAKKTSAVIDSTARPVAASWSTCPIAPVYQCRESLVACASPRTPCKVHRIAAATCEVQSFALSDAAEDLPGQIGDIPNPDLLEEIFGIAAILAAKFVIRPADALASKSNQQPPLSTATLGNLFKAIEQAPGVRARERFDPVRLIFFHPVRLTFLDAITHDRASFTKKVGLPLHFTVPYVGVVFADVHENAHLRDRLKLCRARFPHVSWESRNGEEVLWIASCDMQCRDPSVGCSRDMKFVVADFVVREDQLQEFWENAIALLKEIMAVRRRRRDNDIAAPFSLCTEVAIENVVHRLHGLRAATESQDRHSRLEGGPCNERSIAHLLRLLQEFLLQRLDHER